jgi:type II secretory pathway pseudopilin PulG
VRFAVRTAKKKAENGSALITVLIGFAVVGITTAVVVNMMTASKRAAITAAERVEFRLLLGQLKSILEQEKSCRTALGGPDDGNYSSSTGTGTPTAFSQVFDTASNAISNIKLYQNFNGTVFLDPAGSTAQKTFGRLTVIELKLITDGSLDTDGLPINPLTDDSLTYRAYLAIKVRLPEAAIGGSEFSNSLSATTTNLPLNVRIDSTTKKILSCSGLSLLSGNSPMPACASDEALTTNAAGNMICVRVLCSPWLEQSKTDYFRLTGMNIGSINCVWAGMPPNVPPAPPPPGTPPPCNPYYPQPPYQGVQPPGCPVYP